METVVNSKGKFIIPSEIIKQLGVKDKTFLQIDVDAETRQVIITPLRGMYKGKGLMKALTADKNHERNTIT